MRANLLPSLRQAAEEVAHTFSNRTDISFYKDSGITFRVEKIAPSSDSTATVTYLKNDGIRALAFFYLVKYKAGEKWRYFFPTDSHIVGMSDFARRKSIIEEANYSMRNI